VFGFEDGSAVVAAVELFDGRLVALSDPSVLINRMLEFDGNLAFAINALRWLGRGGESRRLVIMTGDVSFIGQPSRRLGDTSPGVGGVLDDFNSWLLGLSEWMPIDASLRVVAVATALLVALIAFVVLPRARRSALDGSWTRARGGAEPATAERLLDAVDRGGRRASFALPAAILRDTVNARLARLLGRPDPLQGMPEAELLTAVAARCGGGAAMALGELAPQLRGLPQRAHAASPWQTPFLAQRDFERMSAAAARLYSSLGEDRSP
jgi:hypothetical protein